MFTIIFVITEVNKILKSNINILKNDNIDCNICILNHSNIVIDDIEGVVIHHIKGEKYKSINTLLSDIEGDVVILDNNIGINKHFLISLISNYDNAVLNLLRIDTIRDVVIPDKRIGKMGNYDIPLCIGFTTDLIQEVYPSDMFNKVLCFNYIDVVFKHNIRVFKHNIVVKPNNIFKHVSISRQSKRIRDLKNYDLIKQKNKILKQQLKKITSIENDLSFSIIIPFMYNGDRYPLFEASIKNLYNITKDCDNIEIVVHETSPKQYITDKFIKKYNLSYVFTEHHGIFDIAWNYNYLCKNYIDSDIFVFFDADIIIGVDWLYNLLTIDDKTTYIAWSKIVYINKKGLKSYFNGVDISKCNVLRNLFYISGSTTGGINIIPKDIFFDVKGWPEDFRKLGYGCIDCSMVWKLTKIYGEPSIFPNTIYHLPHTHKTSMTDKRFSLKALHKSYNKNDWFEYIENVDIWGE